MGGNLIYPSLLFFSKYVELTIFLFALYKTLVAVLKAPAPIFKGAVIKEQADKQDTNSTIIKVFFIRFFNIVYFLQKDGVNNIRIVRNSNLPSNIAAIIIHLLARFKVLKFEDTFPIPAPAFVIQADKAP